MILSGVESIFGLWSEIVSFNWMWWFTSLKGGNSATFWVGNTVGNSAKKSGASDSVMAENRALVAFLQAKVTPLSGKVMMFFPQSITALWAVRYGIPKKIS